MTAPGRGLRALGLASRAPRRPKANPFATELTTSTCVGYFKSRAQGIANNVCFIGCAARFHRGREQWGSVELYGYPPFHDDLKCGNQFSRRVETGSTCVHRNQARPRLRQTQNSQLSRQLLFCSRAIVAAAWGRLDPKAEQVLKKKRFSRF